MTTFTATRAAAGRPAREYPSPLVTEFATIEIAANLAAGDIIEMIKVPKGATLIGGEVWGENLTTAGTSTGPDIDVGWASNSSALGNLGVWSAAAIAGYKPEVGYRMPLGGLLFTAGPQLMDRDRTIILTVNTSFVAANFNTAQISMRLSYIVDGPR